MGFPRQRKLGAELIQPRCRALGGRDRYPAKPGGQLQLRTPIRYRQIARQRMEPAHECSPRWMAMERDYNGQIRIAAFHQSGHKQYWRIRIQSTTQSCPGSQSGSTESVTQ